MAHSLPHISTAGLRSCFTEHGHAAGQLGAPVAVLGPAVGELPRPQRRDQRVGVSARLGQRQRPRRRGVRPATSPSRSGSPPAGPAAAPALVFAEGVQRAQAPALHGPVPAAVADGVEGQRRRRDEVGPTRGFGQLHRLAARREGLGEPARGHLDACLREQQVRPLTGRQRGTAVGQRRGVQP